MKNCRVPYLNYLLLLESISYDRILLSGILAGAESVRAICRFLRVSGYFPAQNKADSAPNSTCCRRRSRVHTYLLEVPSAVVRRNLVPLYPRRRYSIAFGGIGTSRIVPSFGRVVVECENYRITGPCDLRTATGVKHASPDANVPPPPSQHAKYP